MLDLARYRPVSSQPPVTRDLSIAVGNDADAEELGDRVRVALGHDAEGIEAVTVVSETPGGDLPPQAVERLGLQPGQKNLLVRLVLRHPTRTLTDAEANALRDRVYAVIHQGSVHQWALVNSTTPLS
jgi:phenylalanyl-tRNA synthetase alpha chain